MKISYMAWRQGLEMVQIFLKAINKTLRQQETEITNTLKMMGQRYREIKGEVALMKQQSLRTTHNAGGRSRG